jgi:putative ABC transport system ATP-binding protein
MAVIVKLENLCRHFMMAHEVVRAIDGISFEIEEGQFIALVGPSGSGKSTLLNLLGGLDSPTSGRVIVDSEDIGGLGDRAKAQYRNHKIGFVFQDFHLLDVRNALENVELPLTVRGVPKNERRERARNALNAVGLSGRLSHRPGQLSGGERQRVAIARATVTEPRILLADEPTGNLDTKSGEEVIDLIAHLNRTLNMTVLVATHDRRIADKADVEIPLRDGRTVKEVHG